MFQEVNYPKSHGKCQARVNSLKAHFYMGKIAVNISFDEPESYQISRSSWELPGKMKELIWFQSLCIIPP